MEASLRPHDRVQGLISVVALALTGAGVIHLVLVPGHGLEEPIHGLFYGLAGVVEVLLGVALLLKPSQTLYRVALAVAVALIGLWALTRVFPAPFGHGPEGIDAGGLVCKLCEAVAAVAAGMLIGSGTMLGERRPPAWRAVLMVILIALLLTGALYGVGRAAEPLFPHLVAAEGGSHGEGGAGGHDDIGPHEAGEHDPTPTAGDGHPY